MKMDRTIMKISEMEADVTQEVRMLVATLRGWKLSEEYIKDTLELMCKLALADEDELKDMAAEIREEMQKGTGDE